MYRSYDDNTCINHVNNDLKRYDWSVKWKMVFNPDSTKPANKVIFTDINSTSYGTVAYSGMDVRSVYFHKHLGFYLESKIAKANQGIIVIKRLYKYLPRKALLQIYKSFIRPLAITGCVRGTSREKPFSEMDLTSLYDRRGVSTGSLSLLQNYKPVNTLVSTTLDS